MKNDLRKLPAVDLVLQHPRASQWIAQWGRPLSLAAIRSTLEQIRLSAGNNNPLPDFDAILNQTEECLTSWVQPSLHPVINATGVILHTNLGRAPLSAAALQAIQDCAQGYATLEFDLASGKRGKRDSHAQALLTRLTGAEDALVVNNNAAAVLLALTALARRRSVIISRTQLVEIGGGFRIPEVMKQSGARLVEIGTTNRVHLHDYEEALKQNPSALVLHAHHSNFRISGFTSEPSLSELVSLAHSYQSPVLDDQGSGALLDTSIFGIAHEPTVQESLTAGVDIVCFSGDKLLGGPQAGILIGRANLLAKVKKHPLTRAVRADKLCLAALSATLLHYLTDQAVTQVPVWRMIAASPESLLKRAENWKARLGWGSVIPGFSTIGGGSLPEELQPSHLLSLSLPNPERFVATLRRQSPAVIARIDDQHVLFDPRTVFPEQDEKLLSILSNLPPTR